MNQKPGMNPATLRNAGLIALVFWGGIAIALRACGVI